MRLHLADAIALVSKFYISKDTHLLSAIRGYLFV